ncbi:L,D-transpeptidase [Patulibacter sp.]|uniref:L,D-transpeptidase n=1 Tax=Patulibacter sp. TaxID=1912859 RepID=UPI00271F0268|nr:L,D-transpeptidase [Patulibacter sp.]MDO9407779.1 L,D-transpeptidase [Patulibacter sp.]
MRVTVPLLAATVTVLAAAPSAHAAVRPVGDRSPLGTEQLSDEVRITRWASPIGAPVVRARPEADAPVVGRLRQETEDGREETVVVRRSRVRADAVWVHVRFAAGAPGRPAVGWVRRDDLDTFHVALGRVVVDRRTLRAAFTDEDGRTAWSARIGVGTAATPTPGGRFFVRERLKALDDGNGLYGPYAIGTSAYASVSDWPRGGVVGIHGTDAPALIPGRPSHGCVRLRNEDVRRLVRLVGRGTPVLIR